MTVTGGDAAIRWSRLVSLCLSSSHPQNQRQVLEIAVHETAAFFEAKGCIALLRQDGQMVPAAWVGFQSEPATVDEFLSPPDLRRYLESFLPPDSCRRFMEAPMVAGGEEVGVLAVCSPDEGRPPYNQQDREMLQLLAHRLAISVEEGRLLENAINQQEALAKIAAALAGEVEVRKVTQTAVDLAARELGADGVVVWEVNEEERTLEFLAGAGLSPELLRGISQFTFDSPSLAAQAARTRQVQRVESVDQLPNSMEVTREMFEVAGLRSVVDVPLLARGRLMGVLSYARGTPHRWEQGELVLITTLANLLAAAILNARLYEESERRRLLAEAVINNSPVAIAVVAGPEHRYVMVNEARERTGGAPRERLLGRTVGEAFPSLERGPVVAAIERIYQTGESTTIPEFTFDFGPPAGTRVLSLLYAPLRGPDGSVEAVISLMLDITEQVVARRNLEELTARLKSANEQLARANRHSRELATLAQRRAAELEATITNIADAVVVCDSEGRITLINRVALDIIGVERVEGQRTLVEYVEALKPRNPDGQPIKREELAISRALRGEVVRGREELLEDRRTHRDRHILVSAAPVSDPEGAFLGTVEVISDISPLRELDLLKDQFITVAAHEIKTPVTAIKGFAQTLLRAPDACAPRYQKALETMVQQSDRIDHLVREFLESSSMRWGRMKLSLEEVDLTALVADAVSRKAPTSAKHQLVISRRDPARVKGDRERLRQVVDNLLDNAVRYSPRGGKVDVQVRREDGCVTVSVQDQGVGIPKERQAHLFERFYRAHIGTPHDYGGLGVGLYLSRQVVRAHGGEMGFSSEEGKGSTFYFTLPVASVQAGTGPY